MSNSRDLVKHINAINAVSEAWVAEDPEHRVAGELVTTPDHWAECDVYTPEEFDRYLLEQDFVSLHKDVYGVRPGPAYTEMSDDDMQASIQSFYDALEAELEDQREYLEELADEEADWMAKVAAEVTEEAELDAAGTEWDDIDVMFGVDPAKKTFH